MLSGVWGSGKTHFWHQAHEDSIEYHLAKSQKPHIYISTLPHLKNIYFSTTLG